MGIFLLNALVMSGFISFKSFGATPVMGILFLQVSFHRVDFSKMRRITLFF